MTVCPHAPFSQRATWPPSAAVRQRSIAVITFIWPRLMCPALARRHAGPWSRKMSATSRAGHDPRPLRRRLTLATSSGPLTWVLGQRLGKLPQLVERAHDAGDHAGRNTRVARCRLQLVVSERTRVILI